jgi:hypothetical protein
MLESRNGYLSVVFAGVAFKPAASRPPLGRWGLTASPREDWSLGCR